MFLYDKFEILENIVVIEIEKYTFLGSDEIFKNDKRLHIISFLITFIPPPIFND